MLFWLQGKLKLRVLPRKQLYPSLSAYLGRKVQILAQSQQREISGIASNVTSFGKSRCKSELEAPVAKIREDA